MRRQYEWAKLKGIEHRQIGGKRDDNPYLNKPSQRVLADAWDAGWTDANVKMRARR